MTDFDSDSPFDVAVIGAGAAGLMAAIFAARSGARTVALDGAKKIGAKILISGGGRCNVTHDEVSASDFNGNRNAVAKVLRTFDVTATIAFFESLGVAFKREATGKLFPVTDRARTVLDGLLDAARRTGVEIRTECRVEGMKVAGTTAPPPPSKRKGHRGGGASAAPFLVRTEQGTVPANHVILATGGRSVPKTGSDGFGYELVANLGHSVEPTFPALVPLILPSDHWLTSLRGASAEVELSVRSGAGRILERARGSMLFTHFGISGPVVLDISRHWIAARRAAAAGKVETADAGTQLMANLLPGESFDTLEAKFIEQAGLNPRATIASAMRGKLVDRVVEAVVRAAEFEPSRPLAKLTKEERRRLVRALIELPLPVVRDRGFEYAEVTAGGVPLSEIDVRTMESRLCPGLYVCGEILDVDGKIGGYNFQWAWASGRLAGMSAGRQQVASGSD
jgi:predicted Rossmann fold flavoprotein